MMNGNAVLIIGESGSGKSTGIRTLDPKSTFIINVIGKSLPFQGWGENYTSFSDKTPEGNYLVSDDTVLILKVIDYVNEKRPEIKVIIIDDTQYIMANEFMRKADVKGFEKFTKIGKDAWQLANKYKSIRADLNLIMLTHAEEFTDLEGNRRLKAKTVGKLVDNVITLEGMFTVVLYAKVKRDAKDKNYIYVTQNDGTTTAKSPMGMFDGDEIPNDLKLVVDSLTKYNKN